MRLQLFVAAVGLVQTGAQPRSVDTVDSRRAQIADTVTNEWPAKVPLMRTAERPKAEVVVAKSDFSRSRDRSVASHLRNGEYAVVTPNGYWIQMSGAPVRLDTLRLAGLQGTPRWSTSTDSTLSVFDGKSVKSFDQRGRFLTEVMTGQGWRDAQVDAFGSLDDGSLLVGYRTARPTQAYSPKPVFALCMVIRSTGRMDSLGVFPNGAEFSFSANKGELTLVLPGSVPAFSPAVHARARGRSLIVADGATGDLRVYRPDLTLARLIRLKRERSRPDTAEIRAFSSERPFGSYQLAVADSFLPNLAGIEIDEHEGIWTRESRSPRGLQEWLHFDSRGRIVARLHMPASWVVLDLESETVVVSEYLADGSERVALYSLVVSPP